MVPPFNVTATADNNSVTIQWQANASLSQKKVSGYNVYDYDPASGQKDLLAQLPHNQFVTNISELTFNTQYTFAVTSLQGSKESAIGYPVSVTTH